MDRLSDQVWIPTDNLSVCFRYPEPIRKVIYTTNSIEAVNRQFRKLTKTKGVFPDHNSLLKLLYLGIQNASKKWTMPIHNWNLTLSQLAIFFKGWLDDALDLWSDRSDAFMLTQNFKQSLFMTIQLYLLLKCPVPLDQSKPPVGF